MGGGDWKGKASESFLFLQFRVLICSFFVFWFLSGFSVFGFLVFGFLGFWELGFWGRPSLKPRP